MDTSVATTNPLVTRVDIQRVAVVTIQNPPVNALSTAVVTELNAVLGAAISDKRVDAVVLIGGGRTFVAGADITEFVRTGTGPFLPPVLDRMETSPKPVVAAMHGSALGGGLEIAMAAHYRIGAPDLQVGQPEVNLGIIPGAQGTQRLPRLVGMAKAVDMCVTGAPVKVADAVQAGLVDRIADGDLQAAAIAFALEAVSSGGPHPRTSKRSEKLGSLSENAAIFEAGRETAKRIRRNQIAPLKAIEALEAAATLPFEKGCARESELFAECMAGEQSKALMHAFLGERLVAKVPGLPEDTATLPIAKAAVIGAGTMGAGIAMVFANAGIPVRIRDTDQTALDRGMASIRRNYETSVKRGRFTQQAVDERLALIRPQLNADGFDEADIIIEAAFENMALKKDIFAGIDAVAKPSCVLATNTSTLSIDEIASVTGRPGAVLGLHFFSPANVMRLVEIVRGAATSNEVLATSLALTKKLKKVGVVVGNCRGFVGNRMMFPYMREAQFLVEEGATPSQVDKVLYDWGMAMGIFAVDDMAGIDVAWRVKQEFKHLDKPGVRVPLVLDRLYEMGRLGQKTGRGWYVYDDNRKASADPEVESLIVQTASQAGIEQRQIANNEILDRCILAMVNEGARILEEGRASRANDIDIIYLSGYGFPAYRGGPMWYADSLGLEHVYRRILEFEKQHGELWAPAPLLARLASEGRTFASLDAQA